MTDFARDVEVIAANGKAAAQQTVTLSGITVAKCGIERSDSRVDSGMDRRHGIRLGDSHGCNSGDRPKTERNA